MHAGNNEIQTFNVAALPAKDRHRARNRARARARCPRSKILVTGSGGPLSQITMLHGLARLGSAVLLFAELTIVLIVLLLLGATAIPSLIRVRKR